MNSTSVRVSEAETRSTILPDYLGLSKSERIGQLRKQMAELGVADVPNFQSQPNNNGEKNEIVAVPEDLIDLFPHGGLNRKAVTIFPEQPLLAVEFLAYATAHGGYAAVIGWPELAYAPIIDSGGVCENIIAIPDPGEESLNTTAVLCEGLDLVLYKSPEKSLSRTRMRPLLGKLRTGVAALVMVDASVPNAAASVDAEITKFLGIDKGRGRIRGVELRVTVSGKAWAPVSKTIVLGSTAYLDLIYPENTENRQLKAV